MTRRVRRDPVESKFAWMQGDAHLGCIPAHDRSSSAGQHEALRSVMLTASANSARTVPLIILVTALLRLALASTLGLGVDESYTTAISHQLALSYFDHPPLHVWLVALVRFIDHENALCLRLPFIALFAGSTWLLFRITTDAYGDRAAFWAVVALNLTPLYTLGVASWVLPDGPLVFFSLLAVRLIVRALRAPCSGAREFAGWSCAGLAAGLTLLSKYLALLVFAGIALFLLTSRHRRALVSPALWLGALIAMLTFSPVILWNAAHHWVSLRFQSMRILSGGFSVSRLLLDLAGQLVYLFPWTALMLLGALGQALRGGSRDECSWFFACVALIPIALFALAPLWTAVLPHWPSIGWLFAFPLLGHLLATAEQKRQRLVHGAAYATGGVLIIFVALLTSQAMSGWLTRVAPAFAAVDPTIEFFDWGGLKSAPALQGLRRDGRFVATVSWMDAGKVSYALGSEPPVLCLSHDPRHFAFLHELRQFTGHDAIIVADARRTDWVRLSAPYFERIERLPPVVLRRAGVPALTLNIARGIGFVDSSRTM